MASHAPQTILFVTNDGLVMTNGYSTRLGKGQFGIVDKGGVPSALGQKVTNVLATTPKNRKFELTLGVAPLAVTRSQSNKRYSSRPFELSEVVDIQVHAPKLGISVDELLIGYDGINDSTAIVMANGDTEVIDLTLCGEAIGMLGYTDSKVSVKLYLEAPSTGTFTMHEIVEKGVERLKAMTLVGGVPITEYINITPVNSENPVSVTGTAYTFFKLTVPDSGNYTDLGKVQAKYPAFDVKRESYNGGSSTYVILAPTATVLGAYVASTVALADANCDGDPEVTSTTTNYAWVAGQSCNAVEKAFTLQLADDECGNDKLAALEAAYPDLTIAIGTQDACQTVYETTVLTEIVCEECSPMLRDLFTATAPEPFEHVSWVAEPTVYSATAKMGIRVQGRVNIFAGSEEYRDEIPFVFSSTRISIANEAPGMVTEGFRVGGNGRFNVKLLSIATEPESLGKDLFDLEERTRVYFENRQREHGNNYGKLVLGQESMLKALTPYVVYSVKVRTNRFAQSFSGEVVENFDYLIAAEVGRHTAVEAYVNALATAAGLQNVTAY